MNPASNSRSGGPAAPRAADEAATKGRQTKTPNSPPGVTSSNDMQPEDTGTAASGTGARANAPESVMKQEHKTEHESGSRR